MQSLRDGGAEIRGNPFDLCRELQNIAADLPADIDQCRGLSVSGNQRCGISDAVTDLRDVTQTNDRGALTCDHRVADLLDILKLAGGEHKILLIVLLQTPDGLNLICSTEAVRHVHKRNTVREHFLGIDNDGNLARVAGLDFDLADPGHAAEERPENIERFIPQIRAWYVSVQDEAEYRKNGRGDARDENIRVGRHGTASFSHTRLHHRHRILHVHVRLEGNGDLRSTENSRRANPA